MRRNWAQELVVWTPGKILDKEVNCGIVSEEIKVTLVESFKSGVENTPENPLEVTVLFPREGWPDQLLDLFYL